jgi:hypothetical protein
MVVDKRSLTVPDKRSLDEVPENHEEHPRKERWWCP